ncbi:MAG: prepilin-type N-terminal cleavage/methylation domain-containing protein [Candidatus Eremiobacterota bacterium]
MHKSRGFSFMEVLISVVVLSIGILATMSAMTYTLGSIDHGGLVPTATIHAQRLLEAIQDRGMAFGGAVGAIQGGPVPLNSAPFNDVFQGEDVVRFERTINVQPLAASPYQVGSLSQVTVTVSWMESRGMDEQVKGTKMIAGKTRTRREVRLQTIMRAQ